MDTTNLQSTFNSFFDLWENLVNAARKDPSLMDNLLNNPDDTIRASAKQAGFDLPSLFVFATNQHISQAAEIYNGTVALILSLPSTPVPPITKNLLNAVTIYQNLANIWGQTLADKWSNKEDVIQAVVTNVDAYLKAQFNKKNISISPTMFFALGIPGQTNTTSLGHTTYVMPWIKQNPKMLASSASLIHPMDGPDPIHGGPNPPPPPPPSPPPISCSSSSCSTY